MRTFLRKDEHSKTKSTVRSSVPMTTDKMANPDSAEGTTYSGLSFASDLLFLFL